MSNQDSSSTHMSLLGDLFTAPDDIEAGTLFMNRYRPLIQRVIRARGLDDDSVEDVTQETLRRMLASFDQFSRRGSGSFRAWLRSIAFSATVDWFRGQARLNREVALECAAEIPQAMRQDYQTDLMEAAIRRVKLEFHPRTWEMFERTRMGREPARQVADSLGLKVATVYNCAQRVTDRLRELFNLLDKTCQE